jgi:hypothetical protein
MLLGIFLTAVLTACSTTSQMQSACNQGHGLGDLSPAETCIQANIEKQQKQQAHNSNVAMTVITVLGIGLLVVLTAGLVLIAVADSQQQTTNNYYAQ